MEGKVVIITGGSSGIGKALAYNFGSRGSKVVITGRNQEALDNAIAELEGSNISCLAIQADASNREDNQRMVEETIREFGKLDILIANAGISMRALIQDVDIDDAQ